MALPRGPQTAVACALIVVGLALASPPNALAQVPPLDPLGPQPDGTVAAIPPDLALPEMDSAEVEYDSATDAFSVVKTAKFASPYFTVYLRAIAEGTLPLHATRVQFTTPDAAIRETPIDDVDPTEGFAWHDIAYGIGGSYVFRFLDDGGTEQANSGALDLFLPEEVASNPPGNCNSFWGKTVAKEDSEASFRRYSYRTGAQDWSTTARALGKIEQTVTWTYQGISPSGVPLTDENLAGDLYGFGHGYFGANRFSHGEDYSLAVGQGIKGGRYTESVPRPGCADVAVGFIATVSNPQIIYYDPDASTGVIYEHIHAHERHRPSSYCSTLIPGPLASALELIASYNRFDVDIPDKHCPRTWTEIHSANNHPGMGIQSNAVSKGSFKGSDSYIKTEYSSTGAFDMAFGGYAYVNLWFRACAQCGHYQVEGWTGSDGFTKEGPWSTAKVD